MTHDDGAAGASKVLDLAQRLQRKVHEDAVYAGAVAAMFSKAAWEHNAGSEWPHELDDDSYSAFENCVHPDCVLVRSALRAPQPQEETQLGKIRAHLIRLSKGVVRPAEYGIQVLRRDRETGDIEYQVFADTKGNGRQIAWVQSSRNDAEFIAACLAQAALFPELLAALRAPQEGDRTKKI